MRLSKKNHLRLSRFAGRIIPGKTDVKIIPSDNVMDKLVNLSAQHDLVIMGLRKPGLHEKAFGNIALTLAEQTDTTLIFISKK